MTWAEAPSVIHCSARAYGPSCCAYAQAEGSANNSLQRTQPQHGFVHDVSVLRRSARSR